MAAVVCHRDEGEELFMTLLVTWSDTGDQAPTVITTDDGEIRRRLDEVGIDLDRWDGVAVAADAPPDDILDAYRSRIDELVEARSFKVVDLAQIRPSGDPDWPEIASGARAKFLEEHTHAEDEVRFFVRGSGVFYLHIGHQVHAVRCEAGDLLSVPAFTTHWFDMGTTPDFAAIRFFENEDGWVGRFTGDPIAARFADHDTLATWG